MPFRSERNDELMAKYKQRKVNYFGSSINNDNLIDVELPSNLVSNMKKVKLPI